MKYRTKSADVLNGADRLERILDWQLFCIEQEKLLFGPVQDRDAAAWAPGDPIHFAPEVLSRAIEFDEMIFGDDRNGEDYEYSFGNCVRPMIQTYEYEEDQYEGENFYGDRYQRVTSYPYIQCDPCEVGWSRDNVCWMCGTVYEYMKPASAWHGGGNPHIVMGSVEISADGMTFTGRLDVPNMAISEEATEQMRRALRGISVGFEPVWRAGERASLAIRDMADHVHFYVERDVMLTEQLMRSLWGEMNHYSIAAPNPFAVEPYEPFIPPLNSNPFEREEREIVLVEPVAPNLPEWSAYRRPRLELPEHLNLSGYREPPLPQRLERDWSELQEEPYWVRFNRRADDS